MNWKFYCEQIQSGCYGFLKHIPRDIHPFEDHYLLKHSSVPSRSKRSADHHTKRLTTDERVEWVEQQIAKPRSKRGFLGDKRDIDLAYRSVSFNDPYWDKEWYLIA
ncbi:hypothetical protein KUTeg_018536 [Tegillarca granosa]|uniref:Peptidase S8 pro-domain domain-containing protein n=1 Tax=Tegillarca granosa TaxID=220873 RepID=A0ABQ9EI52_TEGGR|nr:hypothetical protein KUTeg_018536 [Tegillarca granosa]